MQPGEIILVQLDAGPRLARVIEPAGNRFRLAVGRNREARLPQSRVIYETGVTAAGYEAVEDFGRQSESALIDLDLEEVWDVVCDDGEALTLSDIGELYLGSEPTAQQTVAILLYVLDDDLLFVRDGSHFIPRDREAVAAITERRQRQQQRTADADELTNAFRAGTLPKSLTEYQSQSWYRSGISCCMETTTRGPVSLSDSLRTRECAAGNFSVRHSKSWWHSRL